MWTSFLAQTIPAATAVSTPVTTAAGNTGGFQLDVWTIVSGIAVVLGAIAAAVQVLDYLEKQREKKRAESAAHLAQPELAPLTAGQTAPLTSLPLSGPGSDNGASPPVDGPPPNNLPIETTAFIGRERELQAVEELLLKPETHLLTLTGLGGTGKTRLGVEAARHLLPNFRDGAYLVALAPVNDPTLVVSTIAQTLDIKEVEGLPLLQAVKEHLRDREMLLVLDNFEQVVEAAPVLSELLSAAQGVKILATSRSLLRLGVEHEFPVPQMEVPDLKRLPRLEVLSKYESVALFVKRAQAAKPYFVLSNENAPAVAEICARLEGLPLAIELAAARAKILSPQDIVQRLGSRLQLLTGGARDLPARQQTLRSAIDWSHALLEQAEQMAFRRLAVFSGGFDLEAAEAVCAGAAANENAQPLAPLPVGALDAVTSLIEKSLLRQESGQRGEQRFGMLETIREYAREKLEESGEEYAVSKRHAEHYLSLANRAAPRLRGPEGAAWLDRLEAENDNMRLALEWSGAQAGGGTPSDAETGLKLAGLLGPFWQMRGYIQEGKSMLLEAIKQAGPARRSAAGAAVLTATARLAFVQSDYAEARALYAESLQIWEKLDDTTQLAATLNSMGHVAAQQGDYEEARSLYERALALWQKLDDEQNIAASLNNLAIVATRLQEYDKAAGLLDENLVRMRALKDRQGEAATLNNLGNVAFCRDDFGGGWELFEQSLEIERSLGNKMGIARSLGNLAKIALRRDKYDQARALFEESLALRVKLGDRLGIFKCLAGLAVVSSVGGAAERAGKLLGAADALIAATSTRLDPTDAAEHERYVGMVRDSLGAEKWAEKWEEGKRLPLEEAVSEALGGVAVAG